MRQILVILLLVVFLSPAVVAQPQYGDLVIATGHGAAGNVNGYTGYLDPANPSTLTTLANAPYGSFHNWVRMAPDNTDLVFARANVSTVPSSGDLVNVQPSGIQTTIASFPGFNTDGYELDHDGQWILSARSVNLSPKPNYVVGVDHTSGTITTFATLYSTTWFNEMAIDRDPGSLPYTLVCCCLSGTSGPEVLQADRQGHVTTVLSGSVIPANTAIELDPRTGDSIIGYLGNGNIIRMTRTGKKTMLTAFSGNAIRILQDDTAWAAHGGSTSRTILHFDLSTGAVLSLFVGPIPQGWNLMGLEVYGSRTLVCHQTSPSSVTVNVRSRLPGAKGKHYALAASLARRPAAPATCLKFPNGEYLFLDATSPLFYLSALNLLPSVFQNFQGQLDPFGNNLQSRPITVQIPQPLQGSGITVFVAGVIFDPTGVLQVTNSHWFVL
jgi:hypothetical protein